ncbi:amidohydrolase family protein [Methylobacterium sp. NEAU 140]|uniref:amidohydrolase family protein n=1 Tax=Methylobacterium sp. NEAU 140 TaxID=3064945 RepID=UPI0027349DBC|nr:amidohydrolase family protein [Methylobacterium sp. NEAU 140]MDP4024822.1 amidohydrolase family protein [Methylobacterium sp. NEAU 140]
MIPRRALLAGCAGLAASALLRPASAAAVTAVDTHAHVFKRGLALTEGRRYAPDYDATPEDYIRVLDANGISNAVLVQPSFLGTDNGYMLDALKRYPDRFRGIAVVDPAISADDLKALDAAGVVGVRLNLIGQPDPPLASEAWRAHLKRLADLRWQVEVQAEARRWPDLLGPLRDGGVAVVADHFGKPDPKLGVDDPGFRRLLEIGRGGGVYVKLSGPYRNGADGAATARAAIPLLRDALGLDHLLWGSDWPHTQFESKVQYADMRANLDAWLPDPADRRVVLVDAPVRLFRFGGT